MEELIMIVEFLIQQKGLQIYSQTFLYRDWGRQ